MTKSKGGMDTKDSLCLAVFPDEVGKRTLLLLHKGGYLLSVDHDNRHPPRGSKENVPSITIVDHVYVSR